MRRYLSPELRRRFNVAWRLMPEVVQDALEPFLRRVEERETLEGDVYRWRGREVHAIHTDLQGCAVIVSENHGSFGVLLFRANTATIPEGPAIAIILHELAHVLQHFDYGEREWLADDTETELSAWFQALAWLTFHARRYERHYSGLEEAISYALSFTDQYVTEWGTARREAGANNPRPELPVQLPR